MRRFCSRMFTTVLPIIAVGLVTFGYDQVTQSSMQLCKHEYALCTSAKCVPQPGDQTKAVCSCDVKQGTSMATAPCSTLKPSTDAAGVRTIYSTFSFEQFQHGKMAMKCPSGTPWTWCLNKRCTIDPTNHQKALCVCDVLRSGEWMTLGGGCDTSTCKTGYWSGATMQAQADSETFMMRSLGIKKSPVKWCQVAAK